MIKTVILSYGDTHLKLVENYIDKLDKYLSLYYPAISWTISNQTIKNGTSREMLAYASKKVLSYNPNIVYLNISSNDIVHTDEKIITLAEFENNIRRLVEAIRSHNNRTGLNGCIPIPIIITPPPVNEAITGKTRTNNRLRQYVYILKTISQDINIPCINLFDVLYEKEDHLDYMAEDGINLNQKGQELLYDMAFIELTKLINYQGVIKDRDTIQIEEPYI